MNIKGGNIKGGALDINNVFVVGAGYMGNGIAQMAALVGYRVKMHDIDEERIALGVAEIRRSLGLFLSKGKIDQKTYDSTLEHITTTNDLTEARDADLSIEAITEDLKLKKEVFERLDQVCPPHALLATNTSAIPISSIASATSRPERVVGIHFFGPVPIMRLVEIIRGVLTSDETMEAADHWVKTLGKETVLVQRDIAGFIANRINMPATLEAVRMVDEGFATPEEVDLAATLGQNPSVGPLIIMDNAGVDVAVRAALAIYNDTGDPKFFPPPLLRRMMAAGLLGRKSGRGFYDYSSGERRGYDLVKGNSFRWKKETEEERQERERRISYRFLLAVILEALRMLEAAVATPEDIDKATVLGFNFPLGPLQLADIFGLDVVMDEALAIYNDTGDPKFFPPPLLRRMVAAGLLGRKSGRGFYQY
jgi:3-hydroxybutyryl-CoA dehydrogenase